MIKTVFNSLDIYLVNDEWDDGNPFEVTVSMLRDRQTGLTGHEARRPYSATLRLTARFGCYVRDLALIRLQGFLRSMTTEPVVVPFWPAVCFWPDRAGQ